MTATSVRNLALLAVVAGAGVAAAMTFKDWQQNPAGLFHDQGVTNWPVVFETAFSWFFPSAIVLFAVGFLVMAVATTLARRKK